jgi:TRAP transporter TAXI family solute receptor
VSRKKKLFERLDEKQKVDGGMASERRKEPGQYRHINLVVQVISTAFNNPQQKEVPVMRKYKALIIVLVWCAICLVALPLYAQESKTLPKTVSIATHPKGALLNLIGGGFAKVITGHLSIQATDRPFTGYTVWIPLLNAGEIDMGITTSPESDTAFKGRGPYKQAMKNLRIISSGSGVVLSYVVRADSGIKTMAELKGKRVSIDKASYVTNVENKTVLLAAGVDPEKDITPVLVAGVAELTYSVMDGRSDAGWASVGSGQVKELAGRVGGITWLSVSGSSNDARANLIKEKVAGARIVFVRAGTNPDVRNDAWLLDTPIYLATHKGFDEEAVYQITKTIWQHQDELGAIHPKLKQWTTSVMVSADAALPYHPGAIRFYKEVGAWSSTMDQAQKNLLAR